MIVVLLAAVGAVLVSVGAGLIFAPAGVITAGVFFLAAAPATEYVLRRRGRP